MEPALFPVPSHLGKWRHLLGKSDTCKAPPLPWLPPLGHHHAKGTCPFLSILLQALSPLASTVLFSSFTETSPVPQRLLYLQSLPLHLLCLPEFTPNSEDRVVFLKHKCHSLSWLSITHIICRLNFRCFLTWHSRPCQIWAPCPQPQLGPWPNHTGDLRVWQALPSPPLPLLAWPHAGTPSVLYLASWSPLRPYPPIPPLPPPAPRVLLRFLCTAYLATCVALFTCLSL